MDSLPTSFPALAALAFVLGARHGLDADHLATIDGMTRLHRQGRRWCGLLFSLGHGGVVLAVVMALAGVHQSWRVPGWLQWAGAGVSLAFLLALGVANLRAVMSAGPGHVHRPVGFRGRWLGVALQGRHPLWAAGVGALFALSFDTLSQAALFAVAGSTHGWGHAAALALSFTAGMLVTDGVNGWCVARMLAASDARAARASRVMGLAVAMVSLGTAALGIARLASPLVDGWVDRQGLASGAVVLAVMAGSYGLAAWLARRPAPAWA